MIGIIVCTLISHLITEDLLTNNSTLLRSARTTIKKVERDAIAVANFHTQRLKDCTILTNIRLMCASYLERKERPAKKESSVHLYITKQSLDIFLLAISYSCLIDLLSLKSNSNSGN